MEIIAYEMKYDVPILLQSTSTLVEPSVTKYFETKIE